MAKFTGETVKCMLVGDSGVGKTGAIIRYLGAEFQTRHLEAIFDPIGVEAFVGSTLIQLEISDTSCQGQYDRLRHLYYPDTDIFLVCCSSADRRTLESACSYWFPSLRKAVPEAKLILVGTQTDLREALMKAETSRQPTPEGSFTSDEAEEAPEAFSFETGQQTAIELQAYRYVECSALTGQGIREMFNEAIAAIMDPLTGARREKKLKRDCGRTQSLPFY